MRISDWSSYVCSSDLDTEPAGTRARRRLCDGLATDAARMNAALWPLLFVLLGGLLGWLFFTLLRRTIAGLGGDGGGWRAAVFTAVRFAAAIGVFVLAARAGAAAMSAALLGFVTRSEGPRVGKVWVRKC